MDLCLRVYLCVTFVDEHLGQPAFCNHMMTAPNKVTVNSEQVLIITFVCFWICLTLSQNLLLFFSQYSYSMSQNSGDIAACWCGLKSRASEHKVTASDCLKHGPDKPTNCYVEKFDIWAVDLFYSVWVVVLKCMQFLLWHKNNAPH